MSATAPMTSPEHASPEHAGAILEIDLGALSANYLLLRDRAAPAECAPVVKANAYGTGLSEAAGALYGAGCRRFCVAHIAEGIALRAAHADVEIIVLHGLMPASAAEVARHGLIPALNDLGQIAQWSALAIETGPLPACIQIDSGMARLGLPADEVALLAAEPDRLAGLEVRTVISHLACADEPENPLNRRQLESFNRQRATLPRAAASLANSSGIFLGPDYHFDLVRPGVSLYGVNPTPGRPNPMREVVRLKGRIIQLRQIDSDRSVGYGAAWRAERPSRIATVAVGYADGYLRSLGNRGFCVIGGARAPIVGRVSMDLTTIDVSALDPSRLAVGDEVSLLGDGVDIDELAEAAGSIAHELLTGLGSRYHRRYVNGPGNGPGNGAGKP